MNEILSPNIDLLEGIELLSFIDQIKYLSDLEIFSKDIEKNEIEEILITSYAISKISKRDLKDCLLFVLNPYISSNNQNSEKENIVINTSQNISEIIDNPQDTEIFNTEVLPFFDTENIDDLKHKYDFVGNLVEGFRRVSKNGKYGFLDTENNEIIACKYDDADDFSNSHAMVYMEGKGYGFINILLEEIVQCKYVEAMPFLDGIAPVLFGKKWEYINESGIEKKEILFDDVNQENDYYIFVRQNERYKYNRRSKKVEYFSFNS